MDNQVERIVERTKIEHEFYCDECGKFIGTSEEYDDGYYAKIGEAKWHYNGDKGWLAKRGNYCAECRAKIGASIDDALLKLGFVREN